MGVRNLDIRTYAKQKRVQLWEIAAELGIADSTFSRKLRIELADGDKQRIMEIIDRLSGKEAKVHG